MKRLISTHLFAGLVLLAACGQVPTDGKAPTEETLAGARPAVQLPTFQTPEAARTALDQQQLPYTEAAFLESVRKNEVENVSAYLQAGMSPRIDDNAPLIAATVAGNRKVGRMLIEHGANVNVLDDQGRNLWQVMIANDKPVMFGLLLKYAKITKDDMQSTFFWGVSEGNTEIALASVRKEADINALSAIEGMTGLMIAARDGYAETVKYLLKEGADSTITSVQGLTALQYAEAQNHAEIIAMLENGVAE